MRMCAFTHARHTCGERINFLHATEYREFVALNITYTKDIIRLFAFLVPSEINSPP